MATSKTKVNSKALTNPEDDEVVDPFANPIVTDSDGFDWSGITDDADAGETRDDIIKRCLADPKRHFKLVQGLHVKNVKAFARISKRSSRVTTRLTFITKEKVFGMVRDEQHPDAFGEPTLRMGQGNNVFTSNYAVAGAMKETAKGAIFADEVSNMTANVVDPTHEVEITGKRNIANILFAGGTVDVLCQYVPANTPYTNPFSSRRNDDDETVFEQDRVIHHVIGVTFGEVGNDYYKSTVLG